ncbi:InlB B-repeat-containing protein [Anaerotardibacter muris]|uniref:InlB B-repeat-containing protein n=1 Tax=Anaerotardibacter muris TaxID=2941505 RepID=UPI00203D664F|nr:InlB B-repeat-containing protein [Anaerotardibacter muris]
MSATRAKGTRLSVVLLLCAALCLSLCPLSAGNLTSSAEAATLHRGDVTRASSEGIVLDADLYTKQPSFDKAVTTASSPSKDTPDTVHTYSYGLQVPANTYQSLGTSVSVRWNDVGFDADDDRIDLVITWLPDSRWYSVGSLSRVPLLQRYDRNGYGTAGITIGINTETTGTKTCCEQHLKISFFKRGTSTPASGSFLTRFTDLDQPGWSNDFTDRWVESIEFISGHSSDMYIPSGNVLNVGKNRNNEEATDYRATKKMDGSNLDSGVVVRLSHGAEFWYYSTRGWTDILDQFDAKSIALSSGTGGSVSCNGKTDTVAVGWRGNRTISITPSTGYKVSDVKVDGSSVGVRTSYGFANVTTDHSINATFAPINYTVRFNGNGGGGTMAAMSVPYDATRSLTPNAFTRTGYTFKGWNTKADGSGSTYTDKQAIKNLASADGAVIDLFAQWEPQTYVVGFDQNGGEGAMSDQSFTYDRAQALTLNQFSRVGYLFAGWNTASDGSGEGYANLQEVKNLIASDGGKVTLFAQWQPIDYFVVFEGQGADGSMVEQQLTFDQAQALSKNLFHMSGFRWVKWDTNPSVPETTYVDREVVKNLADRANEVVTLYAVWIANRNLVVFDANGGEGSMETQSLAYGTAEILYPNSFEREGWHWASWNTARDGSGDPYADQQEVKNLSEDDNTTLILYAQWEPDDTGNANGNDDGDDGNNENGDSDGKNGDDPIPAPDDSEEDGGDPEPKDDADPDDVPDSEDGGQVDEAPNTDKENDRSTGAGAEDATSALTSDPFAESSAEADLEANKMSSTSDLSAFAKTGSGVLGLVCVASALLVASVSFILFGIRKRKQEREAKRQLFRSRLDL